MSVSYRHVLGSILIIAALGSGSTARAQEPSDTAATLTFDFQQAELRHVIAALAEAAGLNVVYSMLPANPVTLRTTTPLRRSEVRALLESVAQANGLVVIEEGPVLRLEALPPTLAPPSSSQAGAGERIRVYRVKHARADRLASTLQQLFGGGAIVGFDRDAGAASLSQELRQQSIPFFEPEAQEGVQQGLTATEGGGASMQFVADEHTNSLLIRADDAQWAAIQETLAALDLRPLQVLIEVLIAEVRWSDSERLGVSLEVDDVDVGDGVELAGRLLGPSTGDVIVEIMDLGGISGDVLISALSSRADVTILSRPVVLAQNNQEARILVGSERPFVQVFRSLPTDNAVRDQVVQYRDVGTALTIRPTINYDGYVSIDLLQEVSTATNETQFGAPVISTREAATRLLVRDEQTVVIGGLVDDQKERGRSGIPLLKDIPLLGALFGTTTSADVRTELFLFLTPHIIDSDADADRMREGVEEGTERLQQRLPAERTLIPPDTVPAPLDGTLRDDD